VGHVANRDLQRDLHCSSRVWCPED
jgi:hypothetical protein